VFKPKITNTLVRSLVLITIQQKDKMMKIKITKEHMEEIEDQAWQILYFESAMSNEDKAHKELTTRLVEIYKVAYEAGVNSK
jgi:hypothetical protein